MPISEQSPAAEAVAEAFDKQIGWCRALGSPFTARLLELARDDLRPGGQVAALLGEWSGDPVADAVPLRLAGAVHALVLSGRVPAVLSAEMLADTLTAHAEFVAEFIKSPPQTNEVGRSAVLLGGFLQIAAWTGPRLHLLEIGASAGLNLMWDRYRYLIDGVAWGNPDSPVLLAPTWTGGRPPLDTEVTVASRAACDAAPVDLEDAAQRLRLQAYVWADQPERLRRLEAAVAVARAAGVRVARADAAQWVPAELAARKRDGTTVLFHSVMWQYMPQATRQAVTEAIEAAGARAEAPLAWLRFEPGKSGEANLRVKLWPGGQETCLATAHPHGGAVSWLR